MESDENPPTVNRHTYRLLANDEKASLRIATGKLSDVLSETESQIISDLNQLGIGTDEPLVCEVVLAPDGIVADSGDLEPDTQAKTVLRYFFDKDGNIFYKTKGNVHLRVEQRMRVRVLDDFDLLGEKNFRIEFEGTGRIQAGPLLNITAGVLKFNGGTQPVATVGSIVEFAMPVGLTFSVIIPPATTPVLATVAPSPAGVPVMSGIVTTGNPTILG